jgi:hypothetical protein
MAKSDNEGFLKARTDPAVAAILDRGNRMQSDRALPKADRAKVKKKRDRQEARIGKRGAYDLETELIEAIKLIAEEEGTTASQVVGIALNRFLEQHVDLSIYKVKLERNPRYEYELVWKEQEK